MRLLRDATLGMERGVNDALGDEITYRFASGEAATFNAWVEFDTRVINPGNSSASVDEIQIEVTFDRVPDPDRDDRITIAELPGKTWAMKSRSRSATGAAWVLGLKRAPD